MSGQLAGHLRRMFRAALLPDAVLPEEDVLAALPGRPEDTTLWLVEHVSPVGDVLGVAIYRWADVVEAMALGTAAPRIATAPDVMLTEAETAKRLGISVRTLRRHLGRFPPELQPVTTGDERHRRYWPASTIPALADVLRAPVPTPAPAVHPTSRGGNHGGGYAKNEPPRRRLIDRVRETR